MTKLIVPLALPVWFSFFLVSEFSGNSFDTFVLCFAVGLSWMAGILVGMFCKRKEEEARKELLKALDKLGKQFEPIEVTQP